MNSVRACFGIALAALILTSILSAYAGQATSPNGRVLAEKIFIGQLAKVDTSAKSISIKGADQKEMTFNYNDETLVISPEKTVQGLTGKTGAQLRISYHEERGENWATRIELLERQVLR